MNYLNSLKRHDYNNYGCGTIAIHNALVWANEMIVPSLNKNLEKIQKMIQEQNYVSTVKHLNMALGKLKRKIETEHQEELSYEDIKTHLKNGGSMILLSFEKDQKVGHYEFYRYENGIIYESDTISSFNKIREKINIKNKFNLTPEAWFIY